MLGPAVERLIELALEEDLGRGDVTSAAVLDGQGGPARGVILAKEALVLFGVEVAREVFRRVDPAIVLSARFADGAQVPARTVVADVHGPALAVLAAERTALNFLQRLSGVATQTRRFVDAVAGTKARIRDTRKTTPLLRFLEKHAVEVGGGVPHRESLGSGVLVKDNHIRLAGSVRQATLRAAAGARGLEVEVEVESVDQVEEALEAGAHMILLDNFAPEDVSRDTLAAR